MRRFHHLLVQGQDGRPARREHARSVEAVQVCVSPAQNNYHRMFFSYVLCIFSYVSCGSSFGHTFESLNILNFEIKV